MKQKLSKTELLSFLLLSLLLSNYCLTANADYITAKGINYRKLIGKEVAVMSNSAYVGDVEVPSTVTVNSGTYTVVSIEGGAFGPLVTSVKLPNSIRIIYSNAFYGASNLTSINLPEALQEIGYRAFFNCKKLTELVIPNSVRTINDNAFEGCSSLSSITLPTSISTLPNMIFKDCIGLTSISIPENIVSIGVSAFEGCINLKNIKITENINQISGSCFKNCKSLTSFYIPSSITKIGEGVFSGCTQLEKFEVANNNNIYCAEGGVLYSKDKKKLLAYPNAKEKDYVIPNGVTEIAPFAFDGCTSLCNIDMPSTLTTIGRGAFESCTMLENLHLPNSITNIDFYAFAGCNKLTSVNIPSSVTTFSSISFDNCQRLTDINVSPDNSKYASIDGVVFSKDLTELVIMPYCRKGIYEVPENVTKIKTWAFRGNGLSYVIIPENVKIIEDMAFDCKMDYLILKGALDSYATSNNNHSIFSNFDCPYIFAPYSEVSKIQQAGKDGEVYKYKGYVRSIEENGETIFLWDFTTTPTSIIINKLESLRESELTKTKSISGNFTKNYLYSPGMRIENLSPNTTYTLTPSCPNPDKFIIGPVITITTKSLCPDIVNQHCTATTFSCDGIYIKDQENVDSYFEGYEGKGNHIEMSGLEPNSPYTVTYVLEMRDGIKEKTSFSFTTPGLILNNIKANVCNKGEVIVSADTNIDDSETNVGFEWRKINAPDEIPSKSGEGYVYNGKLEGFIRNLDTGAYYKVRPYYKSFNDKLYYGEWVGFDPSDYSYFEPTVHTYANINVNGTSAMVRGYVQQGSINISEQGFKYWEENSGSSTAYSKMGSTSILPHNTMTVTANGTVMEAELTNLSYNTVYHYLAFVTTTEGETFYGDERMFTTGENPTAIIEIGNAASQAVPVAYYNINGHRMATPHGITIVYMSDGTSRKVFFK